MKSFLFSAVVSLLLLTPTVLLAQNATSSLRGLATDPSGAAIPGASITIENAAIGFKATDTSNAQGEYSFQQLTPGRYKLTAVAAGFGTYTAIATLLVAQPATVNAKLTVSSADVSVDVTTATETINTTDASIGNAIDNQTIMALPSEARNPQTLLALQPGVLFLGITNSADSRNGVVSGARADQTNITLDGVDNNDQVAPAAFTGVLRTSLDATEEFRVTTSSANADTGRSSGGQVNLVTKSGTNSVHGSLYEYNRSSIGIANDWFNKSGQLQSGQANRPGKLIRNTYGISLGGPLMRDKVFLFGNYEGNRQNESATVTRTVPTASLRAGNVVYLANDGSVVTLTPSQIASTDPNCTTTCPSGPGVNPNSLAVFSQYPLPNGSLSGDGYNTASYTFAGSAPLRQNVYVTRLDFNPTEKHRFYVRASMQNDTDASGIAGVAQFPGQSANRTATDDSKGIAGNYTWAPTANAVNNLRYGFVRQSIATTGVGNGSYVTFRSLDTTARNHPLLIDGRARTEPHRRLLLDKRQTHRSVRRQLPPLHLPEQHRPELLLGCRHQRLLVHQLWYQQQGRQSRPPLHSAFRPSRTAPAQPPASPQTTTSPSPHSPAWSPNRRIGLTTASQKNGATGSLLDQGAPVARSFRSNEVEYYVQDTWRPLPNLTITGGLRHTILQTPYETNGQQVQPTINIHQWFITRGQQAALGNSVQPEISFAPSGQARGGKPLYPMNWGNIAPRLAIAFSPRDRRR